MTLIHEHITPIPDTNPTVTPGLWNSRYVEIDDNFVNIQNRVAAIERDFLPGLQFGPGDTPPPDTGTSPVEDRYNYTIAGLLQALQFAGLANGEIQKTLNVRFQTGDVVLYNRGVIGGCDVSISQTSERSLVIQSGKTFLNGCVIVAPMSDSEVSIPSNDSDNEIFCYVYLYLENGLANYACTQSNQNVPSNGLILYKIIIPSGNDNSVDPYLSACSIIDYRRIEPYYPLVVINPSFVYIPLKNNILDSKYVVDLDVVSFGGSRLGTGDIYVADRLQNGFKIFTNGIIDNIFVRWSVRKLDI